MLNVLRCITKYYTLTFCYFFRKFYAISGKNIFSYEVESGKRLKVLRHSEHVIALHYINKKVVFFSIIFVKKIILVTFYYKKRHNYRMGFR